MVLGAPPRVVAIRRIRAIAVTVARAAQFTPVHVAALTLAIAAVAGPLFRAEGRPEMRTRWAGWALGVIAAMANATSYPAWAGLPEAVEPAHDCPVEEPDSLQISWETPCQTGTWLLDTELGCRIWDWHPDPDDGAIWSGRCQAGRKVGGGMVQWFEHGRPIDRFVGTFVAGRRQGPGVYRWNDTDWYGGFYEDDLPHGIGTIHIAGETFTGRWWRGCLHNGAKTIAVGVPRTACERTNAWRVSLDRLSPEALVRGVGHPVSETLSELAGDLARGSSNRR
jgi:hypothetical protein